MEVGRSLRTTALASLSRAQNSAQRRPSRGLDANRQFRNVGDSLRGVLPPKTVSRYPHTNLGSVSTRRQKQVSTHLVALPKLPM